MSLVVAPVAVTFSRDASPVPAAKQILPDTGFQKTMNNLARGAAPLFNMRADDERRKRAQAADDPFLTFRQMGPAVASDYLRKPLQHVMGYPSPSFRG